MSEVNKIKFKLRSDLNTSDNAIAASHRKNAKFDVNLITSDSKVIPAHRFLLAMFSKVMANDIGDHHVNGLCLSE